MAPAVFGVGRSGGRVAPDKKRPGIVERIILKFAVIGGAYFLFKNQTIMKSIRLPSAVHGPIKLAVKLGAATALLLVLSVLGAFAGANPPQFIDLGTLGGDWSIATGVNASGQVTGSSYTADGSTQPFIWDAVNGMQNIVGETNATAAAINNAGQVVGTAVHGEDFVQVTENGILITHVDKSRAFIWDSIRGLQELGTLGGDFSYAYSINNNGQVVGTAQTTGGAWHVFIWDSINGMQDLGTPDGVASTPTSISDSGQIVGFAQIAPGGDSHAFLWDPVGGALDLGTFGGQTSWASDVNAAGQVIGYAQTSDGVFRPFVWDAVNGMRDLGMPDTGTWVPEKINGNGEVVGYLFTGVPGSAESAFHWDPISGAEDLGLGVSLAFGINDAGQIVGQIQSADAPVAHAFLLNPPPPAIASLTPSTIIAGSAGITLLVNGGGFRTGSTVFWNGSERQTTTVSASQLAVQISSADLIGGADIVTVLVTVQNPNGAISNPGSFTITPANVASVQSGAADPGAVTTVSTAPTASGQSGVTATLQNTGSSPVTVAAASYSSDPSGTSFNAGGGFTDLQISGADFSMTATANFYYPSTIDASTEAGLALMYFNGSAWVPVLSDNGSAPLKDTTDNLDGTISGGRFTVIFSATSTPQITQLQGTFFAAANPTITFTGFLSPIGGADATGGTFANPLRTFKMGSTIPVKFSGSQYGAPLVTGIQTLQVIKYSNATTSATPIDATPQDAATAGDQFRLSNGQWIFNLDTKGTGMSVGIWQLNAKLSDGSTHVAWIQLK